MNKAFLKGLSVNPCARGKSHLLKGSGCCTLLLKERAGGEGAEATPPLEQGTPGKAFRPNKEL